MTTISLDALETVMGGCGCQQQQPQQQPQQPAAGDASAGAGNQPAGGDASSAGASPAAGGCNWMSLLQGFMSFLKQNGGGASPPAGQQPQQG